MRSKNAKNIILKNLLDACFGALVFYSLGYGFAFGGDQDNDAGDGGDFIGYAGFALDGQPKNSFGFFFFQFAVCLPPSEQSCVLDCSCLR